MLIAALAWASLRVPPRLLLGLALALSLLQFFGPLGFMSGALFIQAGLLPGLLVQYRLLLRRWWPVALLALMVWQLVSVAWSFSFGSAAYGVLTSAALLTFVLLTLAAVDSGAGLVKALWIPAPIVVAQALLIISFRAFPALEETYLRSSIARVLSEPGVDVLYAGGYENVLDPGKAGGLLLNGNTASLLMALCACVLLAAALGEAAVNRTFVGIAGLALVASVATGSKTPLVLGLVLPVIVLVLLVALRRPRRGLSMGAGVAILAALVLGAVWWVRPSTFDEAVRTTQERFVLWGLVFEQVPQHPFFGLGFGNWRQLMVDRVVNNPQLAGDPTLRVLPPHNLLLQAWVDAGIVSFLLTAVLAILPIVIVIHSLVAAKSEPILSKVNLARCSVLLGLCWTFLHGMTDTTIFSGDNHTLGWYGVLVGLALALRSVDGAADRAESIEVTNQAAPHGR
ncbi:O-antigen ligase family protein [Microbacterium sp. EYE_5]|uniref:O-antigen ligase family protein n=1 Tax=unclassified Microbacterium TaxID=2609290 RepID=UPI0020030898|nr:MULTISPECIES: O-antigen ligase family protein [unclassified Microbacterium]MCK6079109.1 O-antigen ligase family protein [Microbacterium sp. EYE_382]MCK6084379.1 O-antigen ligase family protein [Microbacterium sp. EYE_384]MCK6123392.1 O-antigen ligase family protein [Microbacterium sp. EYE_80]MCK6125143.1 O-antigen ligase family protein [Microbacterium sp. EYE_79]MCK6140063.1 O-antigen ligase family protein [Microbacterium sp. EYE_39]